MGFIFFTPFCTTQKIFLKASKGSLRNTLQGCAWICEKVLVYCLFVLVRSRHGFIICGALLDVVPFVQFKKHKKYPWRSVTFIKVAGFSLQL